MSQKILIVIDMQKDFVDGSLGTHEAQSIVPRVQKKIDGGGYDKIYYTFDTHYADYLTATLEGKKLPVEHCIKGTPGWETVLDISADVDALIEKNTFGFHGWRDVLGGGEDIAQVEICGLCTDICVIANALLLRTFYPDTPITADASCCAGTTPEAHSAALAVMKSCQIDVINE